MLESMGASEEELFHDLYDPIMDADSQQRLARLALRTRFATAQHPATFQGGNLEGWWTTKPLALQQALRAIGNTCPLTESQLDECLADRASDRRLDLLGMSRGR